MPVFALDMGYVSSQALMGALNIAPTFSKGSTVEQFKAFRDYVKHYLETFKFTAEPMPV